MSGGANEGRKDEEQQQEGRREKIELQKQVGSEKTDEVEERLLKKQRVTRDLQEQVRNGRDSEEEWTEERSDRIKQKKKENLNKPDRATMRPGRVSA